MLCLVTVIRVLVVCMVVCVRDSRALTLTYRSLETSLVARSRLTSVQLLLVRDSALAVTLPVVRVSASRRDGAVLLSMVTARFCVIIAFVMIGSRESIFAAVKSREIFLRVLTIVVCAVYIDISLLFTMIMSIWIALPLLLLRALL